MDIRCVQACVYLFFYTFSFVCRLLYQIVKIKIYENVIFPVCLFLLGVKRGLSHWRKNVGWGFWEDGVLRRLFGCERDEVTGGWINLNDGGFLISTIFLSGLRPHQVVHKYQRFWGGLHPSLGFWYLNWSCDFSFLPDVIRMAGQRGRGGWSLWQAWKTKNIRTCTGLRWQSLEMGDRL